MQLTRPAFATDPRSFGRGRPRIHGTKAAISITPDVKLFATTFIAGFLVVSILIG
jgi:hypothetical protein